MFRRLSVALLIASTSACYTYVPVHTDTPATSPDIVRVELTDQGTVDITPALGTAVQFLEGPVAQMTTSSLELQVTSLRRRGETLYKDWTGDRLTIPTSNIREIQVKTMDHRKTTLAVIAAAATSVGIVLLVGNATGIFTGNGGKVINTNIH